MTQDTKKIFKWGGLGIFFLLMVAYTVFVSRGLIFGIELKNVNLSDGAEYTEGVQKIVGNAKNAINLTLNGREISINQAGDFEEMVALLPGYNILNIRAEDKFGYVDEKNYQVINNEHSEYILLDPMR